MTLARATRLAIEALVFWGVVGLGLQWMGYSLFSKIFYAIAIGLFILAFVNVRGTTEQQSHEPN